jgi:hypothetical protein
MRPRDSVKATIRHRFVVLELAKGWVELRRTGLWTLKHPGRKGELTLSMFPVAQGIAMDLATLEALSRERQSKSVFGRMQVFFDETSWSRGAVFCLVTSARLRRPHGIRLPFLWPGDDRTAFLRSWTVSDGAYVLEASFREYSEQNFHEGSKNGDTMMLSVRFEGPS